VGLADGGVKVPRGKNNQKIKDNFMPALLDIALALIVFAGAFFLGAVGMTLFKELTNGNNKDDQNPPASK